MDPAFRRKLAVLGSARIWAHEHQIPHNHCAEKTLGYLRSTETVRHVEGKLIPIAKA